MSSFFPSLETALIFFNRFHCPGGGKGEGVEGVEGIEGGGVREGVEGVEGVKEEEEEEGDKEREGRIWERMKENFSPVQDRDVVLGGFYFFFLSLSDYFSFLLILTSLPPLCFPGHTKFLADPLQVFMLTIHFVRTSMAKQHGLTPKEAHSLYTKEEEDLGFLDVLKPLTNGTLSNIEWALKYGRFRGRIRGEDWAKMVFEGWGQATKKEKERALGVLMMMGGAVAGPGWDMIFVKGKALFVKKEEAMMRHFRPKWGGGDCSVSDDEFLRTYGEELSSMMEKREKTLRVLDKKKKSL